MLIVVRHAMPAVTPGEPPQAWHLGEEGRAAAIAMAECLPTGAYLVSSAEPKARETLDPAAGVTSDSAVARPAVPLDPAAAVTSDGNVARPAAAAARLRAGLVEPGDSGASVVTDARFNEVLREGEPFGGNFRALRLAYVGGTDHPRWEARANVSARFGRGIAAHQRMAGERPLVVATHGMALTLWLTEVVDLDDPPAFWADLRLPDAFAVDVAARRVTRIPIG